MRQCQIKHEHSWCFFLLLPHTSLSMIRVSFLFCAAVLFQFATTQTTRCSTSLRRGGLCVNTDQQCPVNTFEFPQLSNYVGCDSTVKKCCAYDNTYPVKNPFAPEALRPVRQCGIGSLDLSTKILNGGKTGPCDWPFVVSIRGGANDNGGLTYANTVHTCQGVLIDTKWVLTSAFCILAAASTVDKAPSKMLVVAGEYNIYDIDINPRTGQQQEQVINVKKAYLYPTYRYNNFNDSLPFEDTFGINSHNVGLIELSEPITGKCSGLICLPTVPELQNTCAEFKECIITGWGFTKTDFETLPETLMRGRVRLLSVTACDFLSRRFGLTDARPLGTICQSPRGGTSTDTCLGDGGGPVMCYNGFNWVVRGIIPFNLCSGTTGEFNLFVTDINFHIPWIRTITKIGYSV